MVTHGRVMAIPNYGSTVTGEFAGGFYRHRRSKGEFARVVVVAKVEDFFFLNFLNDM
jgi:hypothetical protein